MILILKDYKEDQCHHPWRHIHPNDGVSLDVNSIIDALDSKYDEYYANIEPVSFSSCPDDYILSEEGAHWRFDQIVYDTAT